MYSIGEFSKITGLTAKALRYYHENGLLAPDKIDEINNYRFYNERQIESALVISELKGGRAATLIHKGPYEMIGNSYKKIIDYLKKKNIRPKLPSREVYLKGPRLLFNNPKKYVTEIQFMLF